MASVYFIAVISNAKAVYEKAEQVYTGNAIFRLSDDKFFIASEDSSLEVSTKIGMRDGTIGTGLALRVTTYNGRATSALWEWLTPRMEK